MKKSCAEVGIICNDAAYLFAYQPQHMVRFINCPRIYADSPFVAIINLSLRNAAVFRVDISGTARKGVGAAVLNGICAEKASGNFRGEFSAE